MSYQLGETLERSDSQPARHTSDRYIDQGEGLILEAALAAEKLKSLPPRQAESYAASFKKGTDKLSAMQDKLTESSRLMPAELPSPLKKVALQQFPTSRKRAMTGREAAEEQERGEARQCRRAAV
jgi:hypothetical protein